MRLESRDPRNIHLEVSLNLRLIWEKEEVKGKYLDTGLTQKPTKIIQKNTFACVKVCNEAEKFQSLKRTSKTPTEFEYQNLSPWLNSKQGYGRNHTY